MILEQHFKNKISEIKDWISKDPLLAFVIAIIWFSLFLFIIYPLFEAVKLSLLPDGNFSFYVYKRIFTERILRRTLINSLSLGVTVACTGTIAGFIFAYSINRTNVPLKSFFKVIALLPIISPPFMIALSVILLFGKNGLISNQLLHLENFNIYGLKGLIIVQTMGLFPIAYLVLTGVLQSINPDLENAASNLGASKLRTFLSVTIPLSAPGIAGAWLLVFVESLADFGNPMVLSGRFDVLSVQAYLQFTGMGDLPKGAGLAIILLIPTLSAFIFQKYWISKKSYITITGKPSGARVIAANPLLRFALLFLCLILSLSIILFYLTVIVGSFIKLWGVNYTLTLDHFRYAWDVGFETLKDTIILSAAATPFTGIMGMVIAFLVIRKKFIGKEAMEFISMLTFAVPGTVVGIGYILAFNRPLFGIPGFVLTGTAAIIILNFIFRNMPVGIEAGVAALKQIHPEIEEASTNLGGDSYINFKKIVLPLIEPAFFAGMAYSFVRSMTAISAIIFLVSAKWNHFTVLILAETEIMRLGPASVFCFILIVVVMVSLGIIKKITGGGKIASTLQ